MSTDTNGIFHDWNKSNGLSQDIRIVDESPRDGLQGIDGNITLEQRQALIKFSELIGVNDTTVGIYSNTVSNSVTEELVRFMTGMKVSPIVLGRTLNEDSKFLEHLFELNSNLVPLLFFGSSGMRAKVQNWNLDAMFGNLESHATRLAHLGATVMVATEDTTRTSPKNLEKLAQVAINSGSKRICIADTVGYATPNGARNIVKFVKSYLNSNGGEGILIDWHGHNDRGLAVANAMAAIDAGATAAHGVVNGIGERSGNMSLELFMLNLHLNKTRTVDGLEHLQKYAAYYAEITGIPIHEFQPMFGKNAFNTYAGIHADAIYKALHAGDQKAAELVYSAYRPSLIGMKLTSNITSYSGLSNVFLLCMLNDIPEPSTEIAELILNEGQRIEREEKRLITPDEVHNLVRKYTIPSEL